MGEKTEEIIRDHLFKLMFTQLGEPNTMRGIAASATFTIKGTLGGGVCAAEGSLEYLLPDGTKCGHKNDILLTSASGKHVGIEIKFFSAVSDQFKARSYDMLHLKKVHGENIVGVMVYVHAAGSGIAIPRARAMCYPYDLFFGLHFDPGIFDPERWSDVVRGIEAAIVSP